MTDEEYEAAVNTLADLDVVAGYTKKERDDAAYLVSRCERMGKMSLVQHVFGVAGGFCSPLCVDVEGVVFPVGNSGAELPCIGKLCTQNDAGTASLLEEG
jgi:hypothetical protein